MYQPVRRQAQARQSLRLRRWADAFNDSQGERVGVGDSFPAGLVPLAKQMGHAGVGEGSRGKSTIRGRYSGEVEHSVYRIRQMDELKEYFERDINLYFDLHEHFNAINRILQEVLVVQGIPFHVIHDSLSLVNADDTKTLISHLNQLY